MQKLIQSHSEQDTFAILQLAIKQIDLLSRSIEIMDNRIKELEKALKVGIVPLSSNRGADYHISPITAE